MTVRWLAIDIGGANIKLADTSSFARSWPFPLWKNRGLLPEKLSEILQSCPSFDRLAVTMTGELADCFQSKTEGVRYILAATRQASGTVPLAVYTIHGGWLDEAQAAQAPLMVAASNWLAAATFSARFVKQHGWLLDIGSTTTDIVPFRDGLPRPLGRDDVSRLQARELVYSGVERTPICAVVNSVPYQGTACPIAAEWFATTLDVYLLTGDVPERAENQDTADGRPATSECARHRLARLLCADESQFNEADARVAADYIAARQREQLRLAQEIVVGSLPRPRVAVVSGHAAFLARSLVEPLADEVVMLHERIGEQASRCAPAYALACLAEEM